MKDQTIVRHVTLPVMSALTSVTKLLNHALHAKQITSCIQIPTLASTSVLQASPKTVSFALGVLMLLC